MVTFLGVVAIADHGIMRVSRLGLPDVGLRDEFVLYTASCCKLKTNSKLICATSNLRTALP